VVTFWWRQEEERARESEARMAELIATQNELTGRLASLQDNSIAQQSVQNKQTRGAFGQSRMEAIVQDGLPMGAYEFQATLSNGKRPDCTIRMPNDGPVLVIDAKFPLEAWNTMKNVEPGTLNREAPAQFRRDMEVHIKDISEKYLLPGETQDTAFLFVPSESIFAEIHENFEGIVQKAHKSRVVIVSPSLLLLSIQVIQAILKDARMREQAHLIQGEVMKFMDDLNRLDDRIRKLKTHHDQSGKDIDQILISTDKLTRHGAKIDSLEFGEVESSKTSTEKPGKPFLRAIDGEG